MAADDDARRTQPLPCVRGLPQNQPIAVCDALGSGCSGTERDRLLFDQFEEDWIADGELSDQAKNNTLDNFGLVFDRKFMSTVVNRVDTNEEIFKKLLDDEDFKDAVADFYRRKVYDRLRETA